MFSESSRLPRLGSTLDADLDITPMIDVTFLLLIFFMVTSKMDRSTELQVPQARNGLGVSQEQSTVISIFKTEGEPEIYLSNERRENGPVEPAAVTPYVQAAVAEGRLDVIIKADRDVPSGIVDEVTRAAREAAPADEDLKFFLGVMDQQ